MESLEHRLDFYVNQAIDAYVQCCRELKRPVLPIDFDVVATKIGNIDIEVREMIPEAAVEVADGRFKIYLQNNFSDRAGSSRRQRFSLAHEIAHTFFFEPKEGNLKPVKGAPRGLSLERACHQGAGMLLIPERFLERELKKVGGQFHAREVLDWAKLFDVSVEVLLRRLQRCGTLESSGVSFALVDNGRIKFAGYPSWLKGFLPSPAIKRVFKEWLGANGAELAVLKDGSYTASAADAILNAQLSQLSATRCLFEIHILSPRSDAQLRFAG